MQTVIKPIFAFLGLVLLFSVPFWVLGGLYPVQLLPGLPLSAFGVVAPSLAAVVLVFKNQDAAGVWHLLGRSFDFKRINNPAWYAIILFTNPLIAVAAYEYLRLTGNPLPPAFPFIISILPMFVFFFLGALAEEIGWTGYATEPLVYHWGIRKAGVILGTVWAAWHFIPLMQVTRSFEWIAWWSLGTISLRVIMVWLHTFSGRSVFAAALFHAMINVCWQMFPANGSHYDPRAFGMISLVFAVFLIRMHRSLNPRRKFVS